MYNIDIRNINSKKEFHELLREELSLPDYYGNNLDALYDVLTEMTDDIEITFLWDDSRSEIPEEVTKLMKGLRRMCQDIQEECPNIRITWQSAGPEDSPQSEGDAELDTNEIDTNEKTNIKEDW